MFLQPWRPPETQRPEAIGRKTNIKTATTMYKNNTTVIFWTRCRVFKSNAVGGKRREAETEIRLLDLSGLREPAGSGSEVWIYSRWSGFSSVSRQGSDPSCELLLSMRYVSVQPLVSAQLQSNPQGSQAAASCCTAARSSQKYRLWNDHERKPLDKPDLETSFLLVE